MASVRYGSRRRSIRQQSSEVVFFFAHPSPNRFALNLERCKPSKTALPSSPLPNKRVDGMEFWAQASHGRNCGLEWGSIGAETGWKDRCNTQRSALSINVWEKETREETECLSVCLSYAFSLLVLSCFFFASFLPFSYGHSASVPSVREDIAHKLTGLSKPIG